MADDAAAAVATLDVKEPAAAAADGAQQAAAKPAKEKKEKPAKQPKPQKEKQQGKPPLQRPEPFVHHQWLLPWHSWHCWQACL